MLPLITENTEKIAAICRAHHVKRLAIFGSAVRDDFNPATSDIDLLHEFDPTRMADYAKNDLSFIEDLEALFGRKVDLIRLEAVKSPFLRRSIRKGETLLYAA